jgi:hypothetical protein
MKQIVRPANTTRVAERGNKKYRDKAPFFASANSLAADEKLSLHPTPPSILYTLAPIQANETLVEEKEFGRFSDLNNGFGIKRGIAYRAIKDGKIKSITLREPGKKFGCRLIYLPSVRAWLRSLLEEQNPTGK